MEPWKVLVGPLCLCRFCFSPILLLAGRSVFFYAGTPDLHVEWQEFAERPAVFDMYVGNDRNF